MPTRKNIPGLQPLAIDVSSNLGPMPQVDILRAVGACSSPLVAAFAVDADFAS